MSSFLPISSLLVLRQHVIEPGHPVDEVAAEVVHVFGRHHSSETWSMVLADVQMSGKDDLLFLAKMTDQVAGEPEAMKVAVQALRGNMVAVDRLGALLEERGSWGHLCSALIFHDRQEASAKAVSLFLRYKHSMPESEWQAFSQATVQAFLKGWKDLSLEMIRHGQPSRCIMDMLLMSAMLQDPCVIEGIEDRAVVLELIDDLQSRLGETLGVSDWLLQWVNHDVWEQAMACWPTLRMGTHSQRRQAALERQALDMVVQQTVGLSNEAPERLM